MGKTTTQINKRFTTVFPLLFIFLTWLIFSLPYVVKHTVPFPSRYLVTFFQPWQPYYGMPTKNNAMPDVITQIFPWRYHSIQSLKQGGWGLWNPYSFSGSVHAGNYQSAPYQPLNLLFFIFPFIHAWSLLVLLQPLAAGIGMYLLLRSLDRSNMSSLLCSIGFMFCGFITVWMAYSTLGWAVLYLPYMLYALTVISKQIKANKKISFYLLSMIPIGTALSFLSGHFQMSLYVFLVSIAYACSLGRKTCIKSLPFFFLGIVLSLPQLAVAFDAFLLSDRSQNFITNAGIPFHYLITLFAPDFFGNPVTRNDWFGQYAEWSSYIGVLPAFMAITTLFVHPLKPYRFFLGVGLVSLLLAVLSPVSSLFYQLKIPVLSTSVATRMIFFFSFSLLVIASFGFDSVFLNVKISLRRFRISIFWLIVVILIWSIIYFVKPMNAAYVQTALRNLILPTFIISIGIVFFYLSKYHALRKLLFIIMLLITAADVLRFSGKWMPFEEQKFVYPDVPLTTYLKETVKHDRIFSNAGNEMNTYMGIQSIEGYDALYNARYAEFISAAGNGSVRPLERSVVKIDRGGEYTKTWFDLLGVKYIVHRLSDGRNVWVFPHWEYESFISRYKDEQYEVFENVDALPKAYVVGSYMIKKDSKDILSALTDRSFSRKHQVILEQNVPEQIQQGTGSAEIVSYAPHAFSVTTKTSTPQLLVVSDVYEKGWKAYVDGEFSPIYRANYAFRAVVVPSGNHSVVFRYEPLSFRIGIAGMFGALFVILAGCMRQLLHERRIL